MSGVAVDGNRAAFLTAHGDVGGGGRRSVKDAMPTDPTRTKRGSHPRKSQSELLSHALACRLSPAGP